VEYLTEPGREAAARNSGQRPSRRHHSWSSNIRQLETCATTLVVILLLTRNLISAGIGGAVLLLAQTVLMTVFTLPHGSRRYGWRAILVYYAVTLLVSNILENLSILTGFPFRAGGLARADHRIPRAAPVAVRRDRGDVRHGLPNRRAHHRDRRPGTDLAYQ
jgi:hypothetical protein